MGDRRACSFRSKAQVPWYTVQQRLRPSQRPDSGQLHGQGHPRAHRVSACGAATPRWLVPLIPPAPPLPRGLWAPIPASYCSSFLPTQLGILRHLCALPQAFHLCLKASSQKGQASSLLWAGSHPALHFPGISLPHLHHLSWRSAPRSPQLLHCRIPTQHRQSVKTRLWWLNECILRGSTRWAGVAWCHQMLNFCKSLPWLPKHRTTLQ